MGDQVLLLGSIPLDSSEQVFHVCTDVLGDLLPSVTDGEVGDRLWWHNYTAYNTFSTHPDVETLGRPAPLQGLPAWKPQSLEDMWSFRIRPGVTSLRFDNLGYVEPALASYQHFRRLRRDGVIPGGMRFQVCLPMTGSGCDTFFRVPADVPAVHAAYEEAMIREIDRLTSAIPHGDLAIQWDLCVEVLDIEGALPWTDPERRFERNVEPIGRLSPHIPEDVVLGYHFCSGTLGGWPMVPSRDAGNFVRLCNEAVERSGRRVDYVHFPAPRRRADESYFAPMTGLRVGGARVYLGLVHHTEGRNVDGFLRRYAAASRYLSDFGIASVCGYGRVSHGEVREVLETHRLNAEAMRSAAAMR
jgi:hypothetical protein